MMWYVATMDEGVMFKDRLKRNTVAWVLSRCAEVPKRRKLRPGMYEIITSHHVYWVMDDLAAKIEGFL